LKNIHLKQQTQIQIIKAIDSKLAKKSMWETKGPSNESREIFLKLGE